MRSCVIVAGMTGALAGATPAFAQQAWTLAAQTGTNSFLVTTSPDRAQGPAELKRLDVLMIKKSSAADIPQVGSENGWEFNCVARTWRWVSSKALNASGEVFDTTWKPTDWSPIKQDATGYMSGFACGDTKPIGPDYAGVKAAIDALWKVAPAN